MTKHCSSIFSLLLLGLGAAMAGPSWAALGGDVASVLHDHEALRASHVVTSTLQYDLHEGRTADGVTLRQYVDRAGKVFAVTWAGPRAPDSSILLGGYTARFQAAARLRRGNHHVLSINESDLAVTILRLPRGWAGQAFLPGAIPAGVNRNELR